MDALSSEGWFGTLANSLEELLGTQGAQAVLSRALADARRTWPQLSAVTFNTNGFELSTFYSRYPSPNGGGCSLEGAVALQGLADSLHLLLECLLGRRLAAELVSWRDQFPSLDREGPTAEQASDGCA
jgi:hypothetical protein